METLDVQDLIRTLCTHISGIEVCYCEEKDMLYYSLNTGAKSDLYLYEDLTYKGRYDYIKGEIDADTIERALVRLFSAFESCLCGRDYYNKEWMELGVKLCLVQRVVKESVSYI